MALSRVGRTTQAVLLERTTAEKRTIPGQEEDTSEGVKITLPLLLSKREPMLLPLSFGSSIIKEVSKCKMHISGLI